MFNLSNIPMGGIFVCGFAIGFIFSVFVLDRLYRSAMKECRNEITKQYNQINQGLIDKIKWYESHIAFRRENKIEKENI